VRRNLSTDQARLDQILQAQHQVIARRQARACGMTERMLQSRIQPGGPWQKLLPGIYLAVSGAVLPVHREIAALLHTGPRSIITGSAACRRWGISAPDNGIIDVLVPAENRCQSATFVRVRRTHRMPSEFGVDGAVRFAPPPRAIADAVRSMTVARDARALVVRVIQQRRCSIQMLALELEEGPSKGSAPLRAALAEARDGIRSVTEADLRNLLKRAKIPMPMFNARLYHHQHSLIAVVDAWWEGAGVAAEVDSREYHYNAEDWQNTMRRHDRLVAHGVLLLHFTPRQIRTEPAEVTAQIRAALEAGRERAPLALTTRAAA
jgi:very-short-patch-repair endonuclease